MLCQKCNKNEAYVYYNQISNGENIDIYLCEECFREYPKIDFDMYLPFSIKDIFSNLDHDSIKRIEDKVRCEKCNSTYKEIKISGKIGCSDCYKVFKDDINKVITSIHGYKKYVGKVPKKSFRIVNVQNEIKTLKMDLQIAIVNEEFEHAAKIRDKIKVLESSIDK